MSESHPPRRPLFGRSHASARTPDERERWAQARQAAEALFAPKRSVAEVPSLSGQEPRDPTTTPPPRQHELFEAVGAPEPPRQRGIPRAHFARIRTWARYGMTIAQVAAVYGVEADEIARILRKA
jgi:hypothetical protein